MAIPYSEKYKSSTINESIPPLQESPFQKKQILHHQWVNPPLLQSLIKINTNTPKSVSPLHHCNKYLLRKIQIIQHQLRHSTNAANPSSENYKSSTINESIPPLQQSPFQKKQILHHQWYNPPLRQSPTQKNTNNPKSVSQFHHCGNPLFRKIQIIHHHWVNSTTRGILYVEKYTSYNIINSIPRLRQSLLQKNTNHPKSVSQFHHCGNPLLRKTQIIQNQSVNSTTAASPY